MFNNKRVSIIIPCLNEEGGLIELLKGMPDYVDEVIVVDNGSTDNSAGVACEHRARIVYEKKKGYGNALKTGLRHANGEVIVIMDGGNSYSPFALKEMLELMYEKEYDFVSGCRFPLQCRQTMPILNVLSNYCISLLASLLFHVKIKDSLSGMMVFRKDVLKEIEVENSGMGFSQEIKLKSWINNRIHYVEMYIPYKKRVGKAKFKKIKDDLRNICAILELFVVLKCK